MPTRRPVLVSALAALLSAAALPAAAQEHTLRLHTLVASPHPYNDMAEAMKETLEAESGGRIEVRVFDQGQLGQDPAVIGEMGLGTVDLMISTANNAAGAVPELQVFSMPYLFEDMDAMVEAVGPGTPIHEHFARAFEERGTGIRLLALTGSGTRNLSSAVGPVEAPSDIEGLRMRTPPSTIDAETWAALGTLPVQVAWGELYAALQTGVAEAMESSIAGYTGSKLYEVAPNLALTGHTVQATHVSISERTWEALPEDLRALVEEAAAEAAAVGVERARFYEADLVETLRTEHGVAVTEPDVAAFRDALLPLHESLAADLDLAEELALVRE